MWYAVQKSSFFLMKTMAIPAIWFINHRILWNDFQDYEKLNQEN